MSLLGRLSGLEEPKIAVHQFQAAMHEWAALSDQLGLTHAARRTTIINAFSITPAEESDLDFLRQKYADAINNGKDGSFSKVFDNVLMIAEDPELATDLGYGTEADIVSRLNAASSP